MKCLAAGSDNRAASPRDNRVEQLFFRWKKIEHLCRQRHTMRPAHLHLLGRDAPYPLVEFELAPFGVTQLPRPDEQVRGQPQPEQGDGMAGISFDRAHEFARDSFDDAAMQLAPLLELIADRGSPLRQQVLRTCAARLREGRSAHPEYWILALALVRFILEEMKDEL